MDKIDRLIEWIGSPSSLLVHTMVFIASFGVGFLGLAEWDTVLLVVTTLVSLEAIYIAIFIQITVNRHTKSLREVEADVDDIQEDIDQIEGGLKHIEEDVDEIQEDLEDITEDDDRDETRRKQQTNTLDGITKNLERLLADVEALKERNKN